MKVGAQLDLVETVTLHGIVDIYWERGRRIARKWPGDQKQPRTEKQKEHWARVKAANAWHKACPPWWINDWKTINTPDSYSWFDFLMASWWGAAYWPDGPPDSFGPHWSLAWCYGLVTPCDPKIYLVFDNLKAQQNELYHPISFHNDTGHLVPLKWNHTGWKCYRGKKRKKVYEVDDSDYSEPLSTLQYDAKYYHILANTEAQPTQVLGRLHRVAGETHPHILTSRPYYITDIPHHEPPGPIICYELSDTFPNTTQDCEPCEQKAHPGGPLTIGPFSFPFALYFCNFVWVDDIIKIDGVVFASGPCSQSHQVCAAGATVPVGNYGSGVSVAVTVHNNQPTMVGCTGKICVRDTSWP